MPSPAKKNTRNKASNNQNKFYSFSLLALAILIYYFYSGSFDFIQDDSFITYRYVENFVKGHGLVFNINEKVEGYTCFLWIIILTFLKLINIDYVSASVTIGVLASFLTIYYVYRISNYIFTKADTGIYGTLFNFISVILLASNGSFAYWSVSGMETSLFTLLLTAGIYHYMQELKQKSGQPKNNMSFPLSALIFLLASLTRPEGNIIFAVSAVHKAIYLSGENKFSIRTLYSRNYLLWLSVYILPAVIYMAWRWNYYGYFLPNTFYAKTGSSWEYFDAGLKYFISFAEQYAGYGVLLVICFFTLFSKETPNYYRYLSAIFLTYLIYIILVGGDVLRPNRFFVPVLPVFYIMVQEGMYLITQKFTQRKNFPAVSLIALVIAIGYAFITYNKEYETIKRYAELEKGLTDKMKITASWLKKKQSEAGRKLVVAATTIGAISYYSDVILIDMLGLTDSEVAHNPVTIPEISEGEVGWRERNYNTDYIMTRQPDYIYFSTGIKPSAYAERALFTNDDFMKYYYPYYFSVKEYNFTDVIYKRKSPDQVADKSNTNQNYKKSFVNTYNKALNVSKDKTKINEAIKLFEQAVTEGPSGWGTPYQFIGDLYLQTKNTAKAIENYKKAIDTDDYNILAHYHLYQNAIENKDTNTAIFHLNKIRKYSPDLLN